MVEPVDLMMMTELDPVVKRGLVTGVSLPQTFRGPDSDSREHFSRGVGKLLQLSNNKTAGCASATFRLAPTASIT